MKPKDWEHIHGILADFNELAEKKYKAGKEEHGGSLWSKKGLAQMLREEMIDGFVYIQTLLDQKGACPHCGGEISQDDFGELDEA